MYIQVDRSLLLRENLQYSAKLKEKKKKRGAGINYKSSHTAAFWKTFLSLSGIQNSNSSTKSRCQTSFFPKAKKKRSHFFTNARIQETLSSDVLWLEHSTVMYNSCVKFPSGQDLTLHFLQWKNQLKMFLSSSSLPTAVVQLCHCDCLKGCFVK